MQNNAVNSGDSEVDRTSDVKFCNNCKKDIAAGNFTIHEVHCVRNIILCPHCDDPVAKGDLDSHISQQHASEPCPECGKGISRNLLEDHKRSEHRTTTCPLCQIVVDKTDLDQHQTTECAKRQAPCQYCSMMLAHSELTKHEDYCGSRTEPCATCGRYIMVRNAHAHQQTDCRYQAAEQNRSDASAVDDTTRFDLLGDRDFGGFFGHSMLANSLPEHIREMLENNVRGHRVEDFFGQMGLRDPLSGFERVEDTFFGDRFRQFLNDAPPPYPSNADDGHVTPGEQSTPADHITISSDDDDDDITLPCEFCKKLYVAKKLLKHQTTCQLSYIDNHDDDDHSVDEARHLPQHTDDLQPLVADREATAPALLDMDKSLHRPSPEPVIIDDAQSPSDAVQYSTDYVEIGRAHV